jgi:hypothetical protein
MFDDGGDWMVPIWNATQAGEIAQLQAEVKRLKAAIRAGTDDPIRAELDQVRAANGELRLYVATLFRVLERKGLVRREELVKLIEEVDSEDGTRDNSYPEDGDALP